MTQKNREYLYGKNAVRECLRAQRRHIHRLYLAKGMKPTPLVQEVIQRARKLKIPTQEVPRKKLDFWGASHQGMALETGRFPTVDISDILKHAVKQNEAPFILALDHLEDPHNVGALLRTAEIVGVHGVILPDRRSAGITPTVVNTSAGASELMDVSMVVNLADTIKTLKDYGFTVFGADGGGDLEISEIEWPEKTAIVMGGEAKGMRRLTKENCDHLFRIPADGYESLNVSAAAAVALYQIKISADKR